MAFTKDDLAAINEAIATGELSVTFDDGRKVEYRSIKELLEAKRHICASLGGRKRGPFDGFRVVIDRGIR